MSTDLNRPLEEKGGGQRIIWNHSKPSITSSPGLPALFKGNIYTASISILFRRWENGDKYLSILLTTNNKKVSEAHEESVEVFQSFSVGHAALVNADNLSLRALQMVSSIEELILFKLAFP